MIDVLADDATRALAAAGYAETLTTSTPIGELAALVAVVAEGAAGDATEEDLRALDALAVLWHARRGGAVAPREAAFLLGVYGAGAERAEA